MSIATKVDIQGQAGIISGSSQLGNFAFSIEKPSPNGYVVQETPALHEII